MDMISRAADTIIFKSFNIKKFKVLLTNNLFKHCLKLNRSLSKLKKFIKIT